MLTSPKRRQVYSQDQRSHSFNAVRGASYLESEEACERPQAPESQEGGAEEGNDAPEKTTRDLRQADRHREEQEAEEAEEGCKNWPTN